MITLLSNPYVTWDTKIVTDGFQSLQRTIGLVFGVGLGVLFVIIGILLVKNLLEYLLG